MKHFCLWSGLVREVEAKCNQPQLDRQIIRFFAAAATLTMCTKVRNFRLTRSTAKLQATAICLRLDVPSSAYDPGDR